MSDQTADPKNLFIPGLAGLYQNLSPFAYVLVRFVLGLLMMPHGYAKLFGPLAKIVAVHILAPWGLPAPLAIAYALGILEFFGGACLALGLLTRPIAALFTIEFIVITFGVAIKGGIASAGFEFALLVLVLMAAIAVRGSGRCALDRLIGREF